MARRESINPEYEVLFNSGSLGLDLETYFDGKNAMIKQYHRERTNVNDSRLKQNDIITAVNGESVVDWEFKKIIELLRSKENENRTIRFLDVSVGSIHDIVALSRNMRDFMGFQREFEYLRQEKIVAMNSQRKRLALDLKWSNYFQQHKDIDPSSKELKKLIRQGIPMAFRPIVWKKISGADRYQQEMEQTKNLQYIDYLNQSNALKEKVLEDIEKDVCRTFPGNERFQCEEGVSQLRNVLRAFAAYDPEIGYCQAMNFVVATLLLIFSNEEDAFWVLVTIIDTKLPRDYYTSSMIDAHVDQIVLYKLIGEKLAPVFQVLQQSQIQISLITLQWFLCIFVNSMPMETVLRVWDIFLSEGSKVLFRISIALFKSVEDNILMCTDGVEIFQLLRVLGNDMFDADALMDLAFKSWPRKKHVEWINFSKHDIERKRIEHRPEVEERFSALEELRKKLRDEREAHPKSELKDVDEFDDESQESTEVDHRNRSDSNVQAEREKLRHVSTVLEEKELLRIKLEQGISDSPVLSVPSPDAQALPSPLTIQSQNKIPSSEEQSIQTPRKERSNSIRNLYSNMRKSIQRRNS